MPLPDYALCVGINSYPGLTPLQGAEADAQAFYDWVTSTGGVSQANAKLILSAQFSAGAQVANAKPASKEIWDFFETLRAAATANNANTTFGLTAGRRLYLFFSGHGFSPTVDASGVLMANAERDTPHNLSPKAWADRFYENGLFEEILLFQDACREQVSDVDVTPPYFKRSVMPGAGDRKRFYAFAAKSPLLAIEKPIAGVVRGVFSATLMNGLKGAARDPVSGEITETQLKSYLVANMSALLDPAERANADFSRRPEVLDLDPFVIVPAASAAAGATSFASPTSPATFPVRVAMSGSGADAKILDGARNLVGTSPSGVTEWNLELPIGLFEFVVPGQEAKRFKVSGAHDSTGQPELVHVG
jgi:hypothetical protein